MNEKEKMQLYKSSGEKAQKDHGMKAHMTETLLLSMELGYQVYMGSKEIVVGMVSADDADEFDFGNALKLLQALNRFACEKKGLSHGDGPEEENQRRRGAGAEH